MDWLRRNWPDLIIGVALVAVIAGIVVTLLSGGSVLSLGGRDAELSSRPAPQTDVQPVQPDAQTGAPEVVVVPPAEQGVAGNVAGNVAGDVAEGAQTEDEGPVIPVVPGAAPERAGGAGGETNNAPLADAPGASGERADDPTSDVTDLPVVAVPPGEVVVSGGDNGVIDVPLQEGTYRVSVDAYASQENAERRAAELSEEGYPVFIGRQGDLSLVLVGPYDSLEAANSVTQRLRDTSLSQDAYVVAYTPDEAATGFTEGLADAPYADAREDAQETVEVQENAQVDVEEADAEVLVAPGPLENGRPADASSSEEGAGTALSSTLPGEARYLQVGAFVSPSSAEPRLTRLESLGYSVTQVNDDNTVKLLVGPFAPAELRAAQARLEAQGLENFPISR